MKGIEKETWSGQETCLVMKQALHECLSSLSTNKWNLRPSRESQIFQISVYDPGTLVEGMEFKQFAASHHVTHHIS